MRKQFAKKQFTKKRFRGRIRTLLLAAAVAAGVFAAPAYAAGKRPDLYNDQLERTVTTDTVKGYVDSETGILTDGKDGYSRWIQDGNGRRLIYADGTEAVGETVTDESGSVSERFVWELVDGAWYALRLGLIIM